MPPLRKRDFSFVTELTPRQHSIILGTLLGDASMQDAGNSARMVLEHSDNQCDWIHWKYNELLSLFKNKPRYRERYDKRTKKIYKGWTAHSRSHPLLTDYRKKLFNGSVKAVTTEVLDNVDDLALAVWFCDDGSNTGTDLRLYLGGLPQIQFELIRNWFVTQGMLNTYYLYPRGTSAHLSFGKKTGAQAELLKRIKRHVPACMEYKLVG